MKILGLIAGMGDLPIVIAQEAQRQGYRVSAVGLDPLVDRRLSEYVDDFVPVNVGKLGTIISTLKKFSVKDAVMGGKVPKNLLYRGNVVPDLKAVGLLLKLKNRSDDTILIAITDELRKEGITLLKMTDFATTLLTPEGILTEEGLTRDEKKDIDFGVSIAKEMGRLDIGQTVIVKGQAVMAIEAIEGTDRAVIRGGEYGGDGVIVIKVSKPEQDMRFDVPVVGLDTLKAMIEVRARVLALEARRTIMVQKERMIDEANDSGITIVGMNESV